MRHRSTILGLLALAVLAAGVYYARSRTQPAPANTPPATRPSSDLADPSNTPALPDATWAETSVLAGDVVLRVVIAPNPPTAFARMRVRIRAERRGEPAPIDDGRITFDMAMPMGEHVYTLTAGDDGWFGATATLPQCVTGDQRWFGTIEGIVAGEKRVGRFRFDLARLE